MAKKYQNIKEAQKDMEYRSTELFEFLMLKHNFGDISLEAIEIKIKGKIRGEDLEKVDRLCKEAGERMDMKINVRELDPKPDHTKGKRVKENWFDKLVGKDSDEDTFEEGEDEAKTKNKVKKGPRSEQCYYRTVERQLMKKESEVEPEIDYTEFFKLYEKIDNPDKPITVKERLKLRLQQSRSQSPSSNGEDSKDWLNYTKPTEYAQLPIDTTQEGKTHISAVDIEEQIKIIRRNQER